MNTDRNTNLDSEMNNVNMARLALNKNLKGYEHPETLSQKQISQYCSYNQAGNEIYSSSYSNDPYSTYGVAFNTNEYVIDEKKK